MTATHPILALAATLIPWICAALPAAAQGGNWEILQQFDGTHADDWLGFSIDSAGDLDHDGVPDLILGADGASPGGRSTAGAAFLVSGRTFQAFWSFEGPTPDDRLGHWVSKAGDVNADGTLDYIVGAPFADPGGMPYAGFVHVFSGATGLILYTLNGEHATDQFGHAVSDAGDLNGDGYDDFAVGAPWGGVKKRTGMAYLYSGFDGSLIRSYEGPVAKSSFGYSLDNAGDVNRDGVPDLVVGAPGFTFFGHLQESGAVVLSGADGSVLHFFPGVGIGDVFGWDVSTAGDVDLDGHADVLIGARGREINGMQDAGIAVVHSGKDGSEIYRFAGTHPTEQVGRSVACAGDVNGDGYSDLLVGAADASHDFRKSAGAVYLYSGFDGRLLQRFDGDEAHQRLGHDVAGAGDIDGDGLDDVLAAAPYANPGGLHKAGYARVYSFDPFIQSSGSSFSASSGGSVSLSLDFPSGEAGQQYRLLLSATGTGPVTLSGLDLPLTPDWLFSLSVQAALPPLFAGTEVGILDPKGDARIDITVPPGGPSHFVGRHFHLAVITLGAGLTPRLSSAAVTLLVEP